MPSFRRWYVPGGTYFFTVVTQNRTPIFEEERARNLLGKAMRAVCQESPFATLAIVLLPDHLHCVWTLPPGDLDYSARWQRIKGRFTHGWIADGGIESLSTRSRRIKGERGVWQRRFWERSVRDELELGHLCDYIHHNPVKHGYAPSPRDWLWSSFHRSVAAGDYPIDWGRQDRNCLSVEGDE